MAVKYIEWLKYAGLNTPAAEVVEGNTAFKINEVIFPVSIEMYRKRLPELVAFLNYFTEEYDPEQELVCRMIEIKNNPQSDIIIGMNLREIIRCINSIITPSIETKVRRMVVDNTGKESHPSLLKAVASTDQFIRTTELEFISSIIKLVTPMVTYLVVVTTFDRDDILFPVYEQLLSNFPEGRSVLYGLQRTTINVVDVHRSTNKILWDTNDCDTLDIVNSIFKKSLVSHTLFKLGFDNNPHTLIRTVIDKQLQYFSMRDSVVDGKPENRGK